MITATRDNRSEAFRSNGYELPVRYAFRQLSLSQWSFTDRQFWLDLFKVSRRPRKSVTKRLRTSSCFTGTGIDCCGYDEGRLCRAPGDIVFIGESSMP